MKISNNAKIVVSTLAMAISLGLGNVAYSAEVDDTPQTCHFRDINGPVGSGGFSRAVLNTTADGIKTFGTTVPTMGITIDQNVNGEAFQVILNEEVINQNATLFLTPCGEEDSLCASHGEEMVNEGWVINSEAGGFRNTSTWAFEFSNELVSSGTLIIASSKVYEDGTVLPAVSTDLTFNCTEIVDSNDLDGDGISNDVDTDIDGDGIANEVDTDIDGDGIANEVDTDSQNNSIDTEISTNAEVDSAPWSPAAAPSENGAGSLGFGLSIIGLLGLARRKMK